MSIWDGRFYSGPIKYNWSQLNGGRDFRGMGFQMGVNTQTGTQTIIPGYENILRLSLIHPYNQILQNQKQIQGYGTQLGNISDILNKPPARPTAPGLTGTTQPKYVS